MNKTSEYTAEQKEKFIRAALREAAKAEACGEVPVGAVIVSGGKIIARGHNERETKADATAHAEVVAIRKASRKLGRWNLSECDIFVTLEPCVMCSGAIIYSRIRGVYYGASDLRFGCCGTIMNLVTDERFNHRAYVEGGILKEQCVQPIKKFFADKRGK